MQSASEVVQSTMAYTAELVKTAIAQKPKMTALETLTLTQAIFNSMIAINLVAGQPAAAAAAAAAPVATVPAAVAKEELPATAEGNEATAQRKLPPPGKPAVDIKQSVKPEYIVCLEDGTKHQMMKRYLMRVYGLTPEAYRERWGLPDNYPMTAPGYSARKREEALKVGLGTHENKMGKPVRTKVKAKTKAGAGKKVGAKKAARRRQTVAA